MAQFDLATFEDPYYVMQVALDGTDYVFTFDYSTREYAWYFSLVDIEGNPLVSGIKVMNNVGLIGPLRGDGLPPGDLFAFTPGPFDDPPELDELQVGKRVKLMYIDGAEYRRIST